jgi:hypothetical protein
MRLNRPLVVAGAAAALLAAIVALVALSGERPVKVATAPLALTGGFGPASSFAPLCEGGGTFAGRFLAGASSFTPRACEAADDGERGTPTPTLLEAASSTTNGTGFTTGSVSPASAAVVTIDAVETSVAETPTISGLGVTWNSVTVASVGVRRVARFWAACPCTPGTITITYGSTQNSAAWAVVQWLGVDQTNPVVQNGTANDATGTATTLQLASPLAAFEHANNVNFTVVALNTTATVTHDVDFAELSDDNEAANAVTLETQWAVGQLQCTSTFTAASAVMISSEMRAEP